MSLVLPGMTDSTERPALKPYQIDGANWLWDHPRGLLADEAGLGKSVQLLEASVEPVLIVATAQVLDAGTWDDEIEKWAPGIEATQVAYSSIIQRGAKGTVPRDSNGFPLTPLKPQYRGRYGTVILDECHNIKGRKTSWANAVQDLDTDRLSLATGTPIPNWAQEAFMILRALWPERSKPGQDFGSYWRWTKRWFCVSVNRYGAREVGDLVTEEHIAKCVDCQGRIPVTWEEFREENWGDRFLRRLRDDVLDDLPPLIMQHWDTPMGPDQRKAYKELKRDFVTWLESGLEVSAWSEPGMLVKLAKLTTGMESLDPFHPPSKPTGKYKHVESTLEERDRQTMLVAHFQDTIDALERQAKYMGLSAMKVRGGMPKAERTEAIRAFQRGDIQVLCASVNTISEGVTLHQGGADMVVRIERSATPSRNEQVVRRLHRIGQVRPVYCRDLVTPQSYDSRMHRILGEKTDQQVQALGDDVQAMMELV